MARGQRFVKEVYEILRSSPQWKEMALLITYDEHGGFYDHVPTPVSGVPNPEGIVGPDPFYFKFNRLGVRVPTLLVSPWIDKATGKILFSVFFFSKSQISLDIFDGFLFKNYFNEIAFDGLINFIICYKKFPFCICDGVNFCCLYVYKIIVD